MNNNHEIGSRPNWNTYFMNLAKMVSERSTCDRKQVGCVIVRDHNILTTGYNGSPSGLPHCNENNHLMENNHCMNVIHAEANAIVLAAKNGVAIYNSDIYITAYPCWNCFKMIINAGIKKVYYLEDYRNDNNVVESAKKLGIEIIKL
jgi:dCMP deaminase